MKRFILLFLTLISFHSFAQEADEKETYKKIVFYIGATTGLVNNFGATGTLICVNEKDEMKWFIEADAKYLSADRLARMGVWADEMALGAGVYPFKKPILGVAVKGRKSFFSEKIGVGPEVSVNKFFGKKKKFYANAKLSSTIYMGEPSPKGKDHSVFNEGSITVGAKLFTIKDKKK